MEAAYRLADASNKKVFHRSPTGAHGGPESWQKAQAVFTVDHNAPAGIYPVTITSVQLNNGAMRSEVRSGSVRVEPGRD